MSAFEPTAAPVSARPRTAIREARGDRAFLIAVYAFLALIGVLVLYPMVYIVSASFSSASAVINGSVWLWPVQPTLDGYSGVFRYATVLPGFLHSILYTAGGTALTVALTVMMAYPLSRRDFVGRKLFVWALLFALMFNGGLIPYYVVVQNLGMINTYWSQIVPSALNVFLVILAKTFFQASVPNELYEAAAIDGASDIGFLVRVVLPISKPIVAVIALLTAVGIWNSYFSALLFLNSESLYPLTMVLRSILEFDNVMTAGFGFLGNMSPQQLQYYQNMRTLLKYSLIVVSSVPMVLLYPLAQKYFVKGVMIGSLKD